MLREVLSREHELLVRLLGGRVVMVRIKRIDGQRPVDLDGIRVAFGVEEQPAPEPADGGLARLVQHGIGPERDDPGRNLDFVFRILPGEARGVQVQGRAAGGSEAGERREQGQQGAGECVRPVHRCASFLGAGGGCGPYRGSGWPLVVGGSAGTWLGEVAAAGGAASPRGLSVG